jgi:glycolate oxidase FAD binding subunit
MMSGLQQQLTELVGETNLSADGAAHAIHGQLPTLVVTPGSVEELAQSMALCYEARMPVVPWGGGTRQLWGQPLSATSFVVIKTTRLNRLLTYEPDDLTISVEAGMTLGHLDQLLAANNQMLPLDAPWPERTTIGGLLATAIDGPRRPGYGTARDLLIGIRVVEATGRISKAGGMVVKNVSGFDMMKLYLGSLGTLAIIVSANFKLLPQPRATSTLACSFAQPAAAFAFAEAIRASYLTPAAVEYLEGWPAEAAATAITMLVRTEGLLAAVERHVRDLSGMAAHAGATAVQRDPPAELGLAWAQVANFAHPLTATPGELSLRLSCLPGALEQNLAVLRDLARRHGLLLRIDARALSGMAYLRLVGDEGALRGWYTDALALHPQLSLIAATPALAAELPVWGVAHANLELMQRIKQEFDPDRLLNPGRYLVG